MFEDFHQHDRVGAIAGSYAENGVNASIHAYPVDSLNPAAAVQRETCLLGNTDQAAGIGVADEYVIQVHRLVAGGQ